MLNTTTQKVVQFQLQVASKRLTPAQAQKEIERLPGVRLMRKRPMPVLIVKSPTTFWWVSRGTKNTINAGGYIVLSYNNESYESWGIGAEFIGSYQKIDRVEKENWAFAQFKNRHPGSICELPGYGIEFGFEGDRHCDSSKEESFTYAIKVAPTLVYFPGNDPDGFYNFTIPTQENPCVEVKVGEVVMIGIPHFEMWKRSEGDVLKDYE